MSTRLLPWFEDHIHDECEGIPMTGDVALIILDGLRQRVERDHQPGQQVVLDSLEVMALLRVLAGVIQS